MMRVCQPAPALIALPLMNGTNGWTAGTTKTHSMRTMHPDLSDSSYGTSVLFLARIVNHISDLE